MPIGRFITQLATAVLITASLSFQTLSFDLNDSIDGASKISAVFISTYLCRELEADKDSYQYMVETYVRQGVDPSNPVIKFRRDQIVALWEAEAKVDRAAFCARLPELGKEVGVIIRRR